MPPGPAALGPCHAPGTRPSSPPRPLPGQQEPARPRCCTPPALPRGPPPSALPCPAPAGSCAAWLRVPAAQPRPSVVRSRPGTQTHTEQTRARAAAASRFDPTPQRQAGRGSSRTRPATPLRTCAAPGAPTARRPPACCQSRQRCCASDGRPHRGRQTWSIQGPPAPSWSRTRRMTRTDPWRSPGCADTQTRTAWRGSQPHILPPPRRLSLCTHAMSCNHDSLPDTRGELHAQTVHPS
mmetsp:Transcript_3910/g.12428  ORF Transcript_3910/g.12428 Transcript_3910/m.12428 type:complete len:238 (+) Transcript_3910:2709-3422(+)